MTLDEKILLATRLCNRRINFFRLTDFNRIYPFTTENIDGYIDYFNLENRSLLTVGSSLDQSLNAILRGCRDISILDICPFTKEYFYLKKAAIMTLSRDEYISFFSAYSNNSFSPKIFNKLKRALCEDEESLLFWEILFENIDAKKIRDNLFSKDESPKEILIQNNTYLKNDESYNKLRRMIGPITPKFYRSNIANISLRNNYDNIFLSNIFDYLDSNRGKRIIKNVKDSLSDGGNALMYYLYETSLDGEGIEIDELYDPTRIIRHVPVDTDLHEFRSIRSMFEQDNSKDGILIYKKKSLKND